MEDVQKNLILMMKDIPVMSINFDLGIFDVLNENLLPYTIKGKLRRVPTYDEVHSRYDDTQRTVAMRKCSDAVIMFLSHRVLPLSRDNAKKIYNLFSFSQAQDEISKAKIAILCKAVSLQDDYWEIGRASCRERV